MKSHNTCPNVACGVRLTPAVRNCPVCGTPVAELADSRRSIRLPEAKPGGFFNRIFGSFAVTAESCYERALVCEKKADHQGAVSSAQPGHRA